MSRDYTAVLVANFQCNENDRFYGEVSVTLKFIVFVCEIDALNWFLRLQENFFYQIEASGETYYKQSYVKALSLHIQKNCRLNSQT